jgi:hypothetical protein
MNIKSMNQATFKIDESSDVKLIQEKVNTEKVDTEKVNTEKVSIAETTKNSDITTSTTHIKPKTPIKKVENIYYL